MCSFGPRTWLGTQPTAIHETNQSPASDGTQNSQVQADIREGIRQLVGGL